MTRIISFRLLQFLFSLCLFACGKSFNSDAFNRPDEKPDQAEELQENYRADLKSVNPSLVSSSGQVVIRLVEDDFRVIIAMRGASGDRHAQRILRGKTCPAKGDDQNGDGIISSAEAAAPSGETMVPLDENLRSNAEEANTFPVGNFFQVYNYDQTTSRRQLREALGFDFDLGNRVVMVYSSTGDAAVPIACGELTPVTGSDG